MRIPGKCGMVSCTMKTAFNNLRLARRLYARERRLAHRPHRSGTHELDGVSVKAVTVIFGPPLLDKVWDAREGHLTWRHEVLERYRTPRRIFSEGRFRFDGFTSHEFLLTCDLTAAVSDGRIQQCHADRLATGLRCSACRRRKGCSIDRCASGREGQWSHTNDADTFPTLTSLPLLFPIMPPSSSPRTLPPPRRLQVP